MILTNLINNIFTLIVILIIALPLNFYVSRFIVNMKNTELSDILGAIWAIGVPCMLEFLYFLHTSPLFH